MPRQITREGLEALGMSALVRALEAIAEGHCPDVEGIGTEVFDLQVHVKQVTCLALSAQRLRITQIEASKIVGPSMDEVAKRCDRISERLLPLTRRSIVPCGS